MSKKKDKNYIKKVDEVEDVEKVESSEPENSELIECKKRVEELESIAKRALADYQNLEKRGWILSTNRQLILRLLPVLDILVMASQHVDNQGLQLSIKQFGDVLRNESVERIETVGKDFDPTLMECVVTEKGEEGKVLSEIQAGYKMGDKVLRPAQVKVGKS